MTNVEAGLLGRLLSKVAAAPRPMPSLAGGCWNFTGCLTDDGYGKFGVGRRVLRAHRVAYQLMVGEIPLGLDIDHLCRNTRCINPAHMEPVTRRENIRRRTAAKVACAQGHPFDDANTAIYEGRRVCRACDRASSARYAARRREASK